VTWPLGDSTATSFDVNIDCTCRSRSGIKIPQEPCSLEFQLTNQRQARMTSFEALQPDNIERSRASHPTDVWNHNRIRNLRQTSFSPVIRSPKRDENFSSQPTPLIMITQLRSTTARLAGPCSLSWQGATSHLAFATGWDRMEAAQIQTDSSHWLGRT
jgi:hypothetical protein